MTVRWKSAPLLAVFVIGASFGTRVLAEDLASDMKKAGKSIAKAATKFGHEVADASGKVGRSVADAAEDGAKTAWYHTRNWTTHAGKQVADATVDFWEDVIRGKEATCERLRRENASLKTKARKQEKHD